MKRIPVNIMILNKKEKVVKQVQDRHKLLMRIVKWLHGLVFENNFFFLSFFLSLSSKCPFFSFSFFLYVRV